MWGGGFRWWVVTNKPVTADMFSVTSGFQNIQTNTFFEFIKDQIVGFKNEFSQFIKIKKLWNCNKWSYVMRYQANVYGYFQ